MRLTETLTRIGVVGGLVLALSGCSPKQHEAIVATVGGTPITLPDYEKLYIKSNGTREAGMAAPQAEREKFLDLMVNYRLKLNDAHAQKLDKKPEIVNEVEQYKGSLAASYITEREISGPGMKRLYDERSQEIRASHILITLSPTASPTDSALAYKKAYEIIAKAKAGADFSRLAKENSQDPSAQQNGGDLYFFTAGQMVAPFEKAAFAMTPGEISAVPVRTNFGLHIIKLVEKKPAPGEIRASHIMVRFPSMTPTPQDTAAAYAKIASLLDSLKAGVDFAELARRQSGDPGSAPRGGDLGTFTRRRWPQPFDEAAFMLKPGQFSPIVRTVYGYHIIKCTEVRPRKTFEEAKQETQQLYQQLRFQDDYGTYLRGLQQQFHYVKNDSIASAFIASLDSTKTMRDSAWAASVPQDIKRAVLLSTTGAKYTVDSVIALLQARMDLSSVPLRYASMQTAIDKAGEHMVWSAYADQLKLKDSNFADILNEYEEGILLYQIEQDRVWNRVTVNDSILHRYFDGHRDRFVFPERLDITEIHAPNERAALRIVEQVKNGMSLEQIAAADSVRMSLPTKTQATFRKGSASLNAATTKEITAVGQMLKADPTLRLQILAQVDTSARQSANEQLAKRRIEAIRTLLSGKLGINGDRISATSTRVSAATAEARTAASTVVDLVIVGRQLLVLGAMEHNILPVNSDERTKRADSLAVGKTTAPFAFRSAFSIVRLNERMPARQKTYDEASGEISSAYQDAESKRLEAEWLSGLRTAYPVVKNNEELKNAFAPAK